MAKSAAALTRNVSVRIANAAVEDLLVARGASQLLRPTITEAVLGAIRFYTTVARSASAEQLQTWTPPPDPGEWGHESHQADLVRTVYFRWGEAATAAYEAERQRIEAEAAVHVKELEAIDL